jgi:hypothetical protein
VNKSKETQKPTDDIEKQSDFYARKIADFCLNPSLECPTDLFNYSPGVTVTSYQRMHLFSMSMLGLENISKDNYEQNLSLIKKAFMNVISWTSEGAILMDEQAGEFAPYYSNSSLLNLFANKNLGTPFISENINMAYYLLCLNELADFQSNYTQSFASLAELESRNKFHETSIDCLGMLLCAQEAFESAQTNTYRIAGEKGLENVRELYEKQVKHSEKIQKINKNRHEESKEFWGDKIKEVLILNGENKHSVSSACKVVAKRYKDVNADTLRNKVNSHKRNLNRL